MNNQLRSSNRTRNSTTCCTLVLSTLHAWCLLPERPSAYTTAAYRHFLEIAVIGCAIIHTTDIILSYQVESMISKNCCMVLFLREL